MVSCEVAIFFFFPSFFHMNNVMCFSKVHIHTPCVPPASKMICFTKIHFFCQYQMLVMGILIHVPE